MNKVLTPDEFSRISGGYDENPQRSLSLSSEAYVDPKWFDMDQGCDGWQRGRPR